MDESTAAALLNEAQDARMAMRRGEDASAIERFERLYADLRAAMHWQFDQGRAPEADRFASELLSFWMATKRLDDGRAWFEHALVSEHGRASAR